MWHHFGTQYITVAFAKSSAAHQPPWAPWAALALSSPEHSAVSSEQRRTPEQRKTESVEQRAPMGKLLRLLWFHLVSVIFLQMVLQNRGDKSICPVLSTRICQKSYFETTTLHNVYILEYLFIRTEQAGTYLCHLLYHSTYICPILSEWTWGNFNFRESQTLNLWFSFNYSPVSYTRFGA